jgi:hypothetical protein
MERAVDGRISTDDLAIATFWLYCGLEFVEVDANPARARFVFLDPRRCADDLAREYYRGEFSRFLKYRARLRHTLHGAQDSPTRRATAAEADAAWAARR